MTDDVKALIARIDTYFSGGTPIDAVTKEARP